MMVAGVLNHQGSSLPHNVERVVTVLVPVPRSDGAIVACDWGAEGLFRRSRLERAAGDSRGSFADFPVASRQTWDRDKESVAAMNNVENTQVPPGGSVDDDNIEIS